MIYKYFLILIIQEAQRFGRKLCDYDNYLSS